MEIADGRRENPNDLFFKNPDFGHPSHRGPVRLHGVPTASSPRPYRVLGVSIEFTASARRSPATPRRPWRPYRVLGRRRSAVRTPVRCDGAVTDYFISMNRVRSQLFDCCLAGKIQ